MILRLCSFRQRADRPRLGPALYVCLFLLICSQGWFASAAPARPNIVVILADDMGYSDIGCYGGEIATPNLDRLAGHGVRFTQFYNTARCCPTRAALLTGLYPHQAGIGHMMGDRGHPGYRGDLNRHTATIPEVLGAAGYRNYAVGKWHVTRSMEAKSEADKYNWPLQRGFHRYYGTIHGAGSYYDPSTLTRDNRVITAVNDAAYQPADYYYTDALSDHAVSFLRDHAAEHRDEPFFLYVAYTAAHWPLHAREAQIAKYQGKYDSGYDPVRKARWEKARKLGVINPRWGIAPLAVEWETVRNKPFEVRCMEVYAAMVDAMDQGIGRIIGELQRQGQIDNTLVLYLQDNGGCAEVMGRTGAFVPRMERPTLPLMSKDDLQHGSAPKQTRDGYPVRQGYGVLPGPPDTYVAYGRGWANVSNTPFREYKHWVHEGGVSTPLIVHWPEGIARRRRNTLIHEPAHLIDIMATCLDVARAPYASAAGGTNTPSPEGVSLRRAWQGKSLRRADPIFFEHEGNRAVRAGKWKLVAKENKPWELYNIERDRCEGEDLAAKRPDKVKQLESQWQGWAARAQVLPLGGWRGRNRTNDPPSARQPAE